MVTVETGVVALVVTLERAVASTVAADGAVKELCGSPRTLGVEETPGAGSASVAAVATEATEAVWTTVRLRGFRLSALPWWSDGAAVALRLLLDGGMGGPSRRRRVLRREARAPLGLCFHLSVMVVSGAGGSIGEPGWTAFGTSG